MTDQEPPFPKSLLVEIRRQYRLEWDGLHGASHRGRYGLEASLTLRIRTDGVILGDFPVAPGTLDMFRRFLNARWLHGLALKDRDGKYHKGSNDSDYNGHQEGMVFLF